MLQARPQRLLEAAQRLFQNFCCLQAESALAPEPRQTLALHLSQSLRLLQAGASW